MCAFGLLLFTEPTTNLVTESLKLNIHLALRLGIPTPKNAHATTSKPRSMVNVVPEFRGAHILFSLSR